jgi:hypothetical protein
MAPAAKAFGGIAAAGAHAALSAAHLKTSNPAKSQQFLAHAGKIFADQEPLSSF